MIREVRARLPAPFNGIWGATAVLVLALCVVLAAVPGSSAAFTARVVNTTSTVGLNKYFTCQAAMVGDAAYYAYPLDDPTPTNQSAARDLSGSNRAGTYQNTAAHSAVSACTRDGGGSTTFDGTSDYVSTPVAQNGPQTFTLETWFRTTTASGCLMGFSNTLLNLVPLQTDRMVYLTTGGRLTFGVYNNAIVTITSTNGYADGTWHHMMATLGPSGMFLYVDGAQVATSTNTAAQNYNGYLKIAYNYATGWPGAGTNYYFNGQLGHAAYYTSQLSATAAAIHNAAGR